jgi:hypothetical protein
MVYSGKKCPDPRRHEVVEGEEDQVIIIMPWLGVTDG